MQQKYSACKNQNIRTFLSQIKFVVHAHGMQSIAKRYIDQPPIGLSAKSRRRFGEKPTAYRRKADGTSPKSQRPFGEKPRHGAYTSNFLSFYYPQFKESYYFCI